MDLFLYSALVIILTEIYVRTIRKLIVLLTTHVALKLKNFSLDCIMNHVLMNPSVSANKAEKKKSLYGFKILMKSMMNTKQTLTPLYQRSLSLPRSLSHPRSLSLPRSLPRSLSHPRSLSLPRSLRHLRWISQNRSFITITPKLIGMILFLLRILFL